MVRVAGDWQPGVIVEECDGWATVFVPDLPTAKSGRLYCVPGDQLRKLDGSVADFGKKLAAGGRGSRDWLETVSKPTTA